MLMFYGRRFCHRNTNDFISMEDFFSCIPFVFHVSLLIEIVFCFVEVYFCCIFPYYRLLFWTDWDENNPRIERCSMSGDEDLRLIIYSIVTIPNGGWPNGLSVDFEAYRLYWVDARLAVNAHVICM